MTPADLSRTLVRAVRCAVEDGELPARAGVPGGRVVVERTRPGGVGEYATPVAFQLAKGAGLRPADVARLLARRLDRVDGIERVEITGAGFLNFVLAPPSAAEVVRAAQAHAPRPEYEAQHTPGAEASAVTGLRERAVPEAPASAVTGIRERAVPEAPAPAVTGLRERAVPEAPAPAVTGLRERAVHEAVLRIRRSQGLAAAPPPTVAPGATVAPVARRDGDVVARYGEAAARCAMLTVAPQETPVFSQALLLQSEPGEFFRVRYAFSRSRALLRNAAQLGFGAEAGEVSDAPALLRALTEYPLVLEAAAHHRAPERLARHLVELADALLDFQYRVLPHGDEKPSAAHRARLALAEAAGTVLAGGLSLLGIDAPERL